MLLGELDGRSGCCCCGGGGGRRNRRDIVIVVRTRNVNLALDVLHDVVIISRRRLHGCRHRRLIGNRRRRWTSHLRFWNELGVLDHRLGGERRSRSRRRESRRRRRRRWVGWCMAAAYLVERGQRRCWTAATATCQMALRDGGGAGRVGVWR